MISSADIVDLFSPACHPGVRCQRGVSFEQPGEDCLSRWEDDGGAIPQYCSVVASTADNAALSHREALDPLTAVTWLSVMSALAVYGCFMTTLIVSNNLVDAGSRSRTGKRND